MKGPIQLNCPLCEKPVYRVDHRRDYSKPGINVTIWFHAKRTPCFVVDDLYPDEPRRPNALFEIAPVKKVKANART